MKCRFCGSKRLIKRGQHSSKRQRVQCKDCGKYDTPSKHPRSARILLLDIETLPMEVYLWRPNQEYVNSENVIKDWSVSCWAAKWLFEPETFGEVVSPKEAINRQDASILGGVWKLMDKADIIITQNGIQFDIKKLNSRFILAGYPPPSPYKNVDTKIVAKSVFGFSYNKLDYLGKYLLGLEGKEDMEFEDWIQCALGNKEYLDKMLHYCKNDVAPLLEDLYLKLLPWITNHPNLNIYTNHDKDVCPKCESTDLHWNVEYPTPQGLWSGFRCGACGAIGRGTRKEYKIKATSIK